jgi:hypothetical protein
MDREAFRSEVATHMIGLVGRLDTFMTTYGGVEPTAFNTLRKQLVTVAQMFSLLLEEPSQQEQAAHVLCEAMFGDQEPPEGFWATEAGRAVALAIGYPRPYAPRPMVEKILDLSRQRVGEMIKLGKLDETVDEQGKRWVPADSIRTRMRLKVSGA